MSAALRILCILGLDRFGDYISHQVVAPVRETCAQALGSLVLLITGGKPQETAKTGHENYQSSNSVVRCHDDILGIVSIIMKLMDNKEWEARHGGLLASRYLLAVRDDLLDTILPIFFPAIMKGLDDPVEDVGATAASTLIPAEAHLPRLLKPTELESIVIRLWNLLKEQDDLAAACNSCNSNMGLLASILSLPAARACLPPQPLSQVLPRLCPFLSHSSSSVRKATLQTLVMAI